ncbi:hypothetical protein PV755_45325 [Streptomyces caniscabiei]|uniref:hypothetical protein n=1 Tax=Streptomyces caniscabiei TaxID=2746961 RepID=UPI0029AC2962|nr:hypothetical protein [Streptomyces caniscabiei]MDX3516038.1 hypothetical protein [Streptomyces caniscabiei]
MSEELRAAAKILRTRCRMDRRYADPLAALLDLIAERHPRRRMMVVADDDPPEYCGACQDPPVQKRQWPCPEVSQALELAQALNGAGPVRPDEERDQ